MLGKQQPAHTGADTWRMRSIGMPNPPRVSFWPASLAFAAGFDLVRPGLPRERCGWRCAARVWLGPVMYGYPHAGQTQVTVFSSGESVHK